MNTYVRYLDARLRAHADPELAAPMERYMRDRFAYLGIKMPLRKELTRAHVKEHGLPAAEAIPDVLRAIWALDYREAQYVGVELAQRMRKHFDAAWLPLVEELLVSKSWWDTVDALASHTVGDLFARSSDARTKGLRRWRRSKNLWLRRTTLLFQLRYKERTDQDLLFALIHENLGSGEFFIDKAIGWTLRELSKSDAKAVRAFVDATDLAALSRREALKWLVRVETSRAKVLAKIAALPAREIDPSPAQMIRSDRDRR